MALKDFFPLLLSLFLSKLIDDSIKSNPLASKVQKIDISGWLKSKLVRKIYDWH